MEHFTEGFLNTTLLLATLNYYYYLSDRRSTLPKEEFKAIQKKSMLIVFFSAWIAASGISIIEKTLLHAEENWVKLIASGFGCAVVSILIPIIMAKLVPIKISAKTEEQ